MYSVCSLNPELLLRYLILVDIGREYLMSFYLKVRLLVLLLKLRLIVLLSNTMRSDIHAHRKGNEDFSETGKPTLLCCIPSKVLIGIKMIQY